MNRREIRGHFILPCLAPTIFITPEAFVTILFHLQKSMHEEAQHKKGCHRVQKARMDLPLPCSGGELKDVAYGGKNDVGVPSL